MTQNIYIFSSYPSGIFLIELNLNMFVFEDRASWSMEETQRQIKLGPKYGIRIRTQAQLIPKPQFIE